MLIKITDTPTDRLTQTEYYKYLLALAPQDIHSIKTKTEFLKDRYTFKIGVDKISSEDFQTLKAIEEAYFHFEIKKIITL